MEETASRRRQEVERRAQSGDLAAAIRAIRHAVAEEYDLPVHAVVLIQSGSIPRTSSGKIRRQSCRQDFLGGRLPVLHVATYFRLQGLRGWRLYRK